jgi:hypothetical protein
VKAQRQLGASFIRPACQLLAIGAVSMLLKLVFLAPTTPPTSRKVTAAYSRYVKAPTPETKRQYEEAIDEANRPWHVLQIVSGIASIGIWSGAPKALRGRRLGGDSSE